MLTVCCTWETLTRSTRLRNLSTQCFGLELGVTQVDKLQVILVAWFTLTRRMVLKVQLRWVVNFLSNKNAFGKAECGKHSEGANILAHESSNLGHHFQIRHLKPYEWILERGKWQPCSEQRVIEKVAQRYPVIGSKIVGVLYGIT